MACFLSVSNPYDVSISPKVLGDKREDPIMEMAYADPAAVDWAARGKFSPTVQMLHGYPVVADTAPKKLHWKGGRRALPDVLVHGGVAVVCGRFRDLAERFEPDVHQFIPVDIHKDPKGAPAAAYHWFNACVRFDSVDPERTTHAYQPSHEGTFYWSRVRKVGGDYVPIPDAKLVLSRNRISAHHLWVDPHISIAEYVYCSDAFGAALLAEGFTGLNVTPREEA